MKVGIIGVGNIILELARRSARSGHEVLITTPRGNNIIKDLVRIMGDNIKLATVNEVAAAELIILFLTRDDLEKQVQTLPDMRGKIILHLNNSIFNLNSTLHIVPGQSSSEMLASLLPSSHIVKLFTPLQSLTISDDHNMEKTKIFFTTENLKVKNNIKIYLDTLNFAGIDLMELKSYNEPSRSLV